MPFCLDNGAVDRLTRNEFLLWALLGSRLSCWSFAPTRFQIGDFEMGDVLRSSRLFSIASIARESSDGLGGDCGDGFVGKYGGKLNSPWALIVNASRIAW